jgi:hypothetical protein
MSLRGEAPNLHDLRAAGFARDLQRVRSSAHEDVRRLSRLGLHDCSGFASSGNRVASRATEKTVNDSRIPAKLEIFPFGSSFGLCRSAVISSPAAS